MNGHKWGNNGKAAQMAKAVLVALVVGTSFVPLKGQAANTAATALPNFHTVYPYLYRGGEPSEAGIRQLAQKGVKTIVDLRAVTPASRKEKALAQTLGIKYVQLPMSSESPTSQQVKTFLALVDQAKCNNKPLFVHCQHGSDRTGAMVGIWRVSRDGWHYTQAYNEMRKYYFSPQYTKLSGAVKQYAEMHGGPDACED